MLNRITDPALIDRARAMRDTIFLDSMHLRSEWMEETDATVIFQENEYSLHPEYYPAIIRACNTISPGATWWAIAEDFEYGGMPRPTDPDCWRIIPNEESLKTLSFDISPFDCMIFTDDLNAAFSFVNAYEFTLVAGPRRFIDAYAGSYEAAVKEFSRFVDDYIQHDQKLGFPKATEAIRTNYGTLLSQARLGNA
ncbi:hypothetical protein ABYF32_00605 [Buchananella felis]|uniref:hypothetical protein n=1 Tax=Buchananella felis TaxID=3231492 RepID=UPI00352757BB